MIKLSTVQWCERARVVHGDQYDYSKAVWGTKKTRIVIVCRRCNSEFQQTARSHIYAKQGCPKCALAAVHEANRYSTDTFIVAARKKHGDLYDYNHVKYQHCKPPVRIVCAVHGAFKQSPESHLRGRGCPSKEHERDKCFKETEQKLRQKLQDNFDVREMVYSGSQVPIRGVLCKECGSEIHAKPSNLLSALRKGCDVCNRKRWMAQNLARRESAVVIIERAQKRHVHRYTDYVVTGGFGVRRSWLSYRCPRHGQVTQRASAHLQGQGCPDCKKSKMELAVCGFFIRKGIPFVKQKRFASCVAPDTRCKLAFDFYIPSHNLCIEVDGKQHEIAVKYFGGETAFQRRKVLDKIKTDFCHHSKIGLLRVKHTEAKNINKVLEDAMVGKAFY